MPAVPRRANNVTMSAMVGLIGDECCCSGGGGSAMIVTEGSSLEKTSHPTAALFLRLLLLTMSVNVGEVW